MEAAGTGVTPLQGFPAIPKGRTHREWRREQLDGRARALPWDSGQQWELQRCELLLSGVPQEQCHWFGFRLDTKH